MEITTKDLTPEGINRADDDLKFILFEREKKQQIVLARNDIQHISLLPRDAKLIGAGTVLIIQSEAYAKWGSQSCHETKGYDRPKEPDEASQTIARVRSAINEWFTKI